jgi:hypothetical protein
MKPIKRFVNYSLFFYACIITSYWAFIQPAYTNWGASPGEVTMKLPGDEFISANSIVSTRAIDIGAPKENVWPWIAQTGQNRGGFNSYYWLENLFGAHMKNADTIHPEWQNPQPGDTVYYGKDQGVRLGDFG